MFAMDAQKRSLKRLKHDRANHPLWTLINVSALSFAILFLIPAVLGLGHMVVALAAN